jgi:predicted TIM-barrel fold metal-dependent hydrolase
MAVGTELIRVNSGDSHILEPPEIWQALPRSMRDRAPRTVQEGEREVVYIDGIMVRRDPLAWLESFRPPGARDLTVRMRDLDDQGIWAEAIFPSTGIWVTLIEDPRLYAACAQVYNDWCAQVVNAHSDRLISAAILPHLDTDDAVAEAQRCAGLGFKAVSLAMLPPEQRTYNRDLWEPLWAAIEETGMTLCFHAGTGRSVNLPRGPGTAIINYVNVGLDAPRVTTDLVSGGGLDRHPGLKVFFVEVGSAWLPYVGDRMDEAYRQHGFFVRPELSMLPSEIIRRQVYASFQHDRSAVQAVTGMNFPNVLWGSDYPHLEGTYPRTQEVLHELFDGVDAAARERITIGCFNELFPGVRQPPPDWPSQGCAPA